MIWLVDTGSSHRGKEAADRLRAAFPNAVMVHTPVHASWLNQVEIYFSIVQRRVVSTNALEGRYNSTAQPFQWKFTTSDLDDLLARLDRHAADHQEESSFRLTELPQACEASGGDGSLGRKPIYQGLHLLSTQPPAWQGQSGWKC